MNNEQCEALPSSIADEIREAKSQLKSVNFITATTAFLVATYERSPYARVKVTLTFPDGYPSNPLIAVVDSGCGATIPPGLKKKIETGLNALALERAGKNGTQFDQVHLVLKQLISFIDTNLFVPCWKELKKCVDLIQQLPAATNSTKQSTLSILSESKGTIRLTLYDAAYYYKCTITIDPAYPDYYAATGGKSCLLQVHSTNFPSYIEKMITTQAQDIVVRMQSGLSHERALVLSNPIRAPIDLELIGSSTQNDEGSGKHTPIKLKKENTEEEWRVEENKRIAEYYDVLPCVGGTITPQPSLLSLVTFLVREVHRLVSHTCSGCKERVMPINPEKTSSLSKLNVKTQPMRTYCGCWYHKSCLNAILTEPPFGLLECPTVNCGGQRIYHPDWTTDTKQLERDWAAKQARMREIEDTLSFF